MCLLGISNFFIPENTTKRTNRHHRSLSLLGKDFFFFFKVKVYDLAVEWILY